MVVVPSPGLSNTAGHQQQPKLLINMDSTCAIGPASRHNLFNSGLVSTIESWHQPHQIKEEKSPVREENSSPINQQRSSPTMFNNGNNLRRNSSSPNIYDHITNNHLHPNSHHQYQQYLQHAVQTKEESNNNNNINDDKSTDNLQSQPSQSQGSEDSQLSSCSSGSENGSIRSPNSVPPSCLVESLTEDPLKRLQMALQRTGMMTSPPLPLNSNISPSAIASNNNNIQHHGHHNTEKPLQCPICTFSTTSRVNFNTHLQLHEDQRSCSMCEFNAESNEQFKEHMRDVHDVILTGNGDDDGLDEDEPGLAVPKINSQGKVKTFRCKQCDFCAVTKLEFWEHTRTHIKDERLLTCPKCPFVTEYKHHLEYHLRNHFGSKPFKCDKCAYTCVNKSMLNSHLKSHSNIYQYRCADCNYATKYCHSLKLHLRKYDHSPDMVLNPDGSPNPLPIVDVYGTRRGPKQRSSKGLTNSEENSQSPGRNPNSNGGNGTQINQLHPLFTPPYIPYYTPLLHPLMYAAGTPVLPSGNNQDSNGSSSDHVSTQQQRQLDKALMGSNYYYFNNNNWNNNMNSNENSNEQQCPEANENVKSPNGAEEDVSSRKSPDRLNTKTDESDQTLRAPLDLSRSEIGFVDQTQAATSTAGNTNVKSGRNTERRRKGKAYKLDRLAIRLQQKNSPPHDEEIDEDESDSSPALKKRLVEDDYEDNNGSNNHNQSTDEELPLQCVLGDENPEVSSNNNDDDTTGDTNLSQLSPSSTSSSAGKTNSKEENISLRPTTPSYDCSYCDICFKDVVMYTMHMGYHGFQDPYTCNMCGEQTPDKVSFFLHIARKSHS